MKILKKLNTIFPKESCYLFSPGIKVYVLNDDSNAFCDVIKNIFRVESLQFKESECINFYVFYDRNKNRYTRAGGVFCSVKNIPLIDKTADLVKRFKASQFLDISEELGKSINR